jgi:glycosyltransferase involved in cell wall biosynthesis
MICYHYAPAADGGAERQAQQLAEALAARGRTVGVVTTGGTGAPARETLNGVHVRRVGTVARRGLVSLTFLPSLAVFLLTRGRRYAVWHVHQAFYHYLIAVALARLLGRRCVVKTAASGPYGDIARLRGSKLGGAVLRALPAAHAVVSLNRELSGELAQVGVDRQRARIIRNGVDLERWRPPGDRERAAARRAFGVPSDAVLVVYVGRLARPKGVDVLLDAWRRLEQRPTSGQLLLAGDGQDGAEYRRFAAAHLRHARFLGRLPDVQELLRGADVLVLPSLSEGLSNAVLEAMAMGLPVVATRIAGLDEQVQDGVTGLLVPAGDAAALGAALERLMNDPDRRVALGRAGRGVVERQFSFATMVAAYEDLYREVTG